MRILKTQFIPKLRNTLGLASINEDSLLKKITKIAVSIFVGAAIGAWEFGMMIPSRVPLPFAIVGIVPLISISIFAAACGFFAGAVAGVVETLRAMKREGPTRDEIIVRLENLFDPKSKASGLFESMPRVPGVFRKPIEKGSEQDLIVQAYYNKGEGEIANLSVHSLAALLIMCFTKADLFKNIDIMKVDENNDEHLIELLMKLPINHVYVFSMFHFLCQILLHQKTVTKWENSIDLARVIAPVLFPIAAKNDTIRSKAVEITNGFFKMEHSLIEAIYMQKNQTALF